MARRNRNVPLREMKSNNLVIVCEGTTTEYNYFQELADYSLANGLSPFSCIKILPAMDEEIEIKNEKRIKRNFLGGNAKELRYYTKKEQTDELYNKYCGQPTRYLREAQLYLLENDYSEGWAVYDKDHHADHEGAMELLDSTSNLYVAFSSYSFEEWLLVHFERNPFAYNHSDCCNPKNKHSNSPCSGENCIAGRLRSKNYITDFSKTNKGYFRKHTLRDDGSLNPLPLINAVWTRNIHADSNRFFCNPYTDVDVLVMKLLNCQWGNWNEPISVAGTILVLCREGNVVTVKNIGNISYVLTKANWQFCNINGLEEHSAVLSSCLLENNEQSFSFSIMPESSLLMVKDSGRCIYYSIETF